MAPHDVRAQNIQAVLWDLDGTLVRSDRLHRDLEREVLAGYGVALSAAAQAAWVGEPTRAVFTRLLSARGLGAKVDEALARKRAAAPERILRRALPVRGIEQVLGDIPARTHRFALVTSAEGYLARGLLERFGWAWRFEAVVTADDVERPKPDPQPYRLACERLGLSPARALVVEDAPHGVRAAKAAGCRVAALPGTFEAPALAEADFLLSNVGAVVGLLGVLG